MQNDHFQPHDHARCISTAVDAAERFCAAQGLRLTPVRRRTLEILLSEHRALGAYDILAKLDADGFGSQPPVAYRALDFLTANGFAHKVEALNAYVACTHPGADHAPAFLICRSCGVVEEAEAAPDKGPLARAAREAGFAIERAVVEAQGTCPACRSEHP
ncbi:MAG: transcriptional repressor [Rhodobacteraceae bacterium]|jgi:Fur family zinc uptake transcriptional regulator|nr:transcriptional repressor [Paracoccaceae bacterium]